MNNETYKMQYFSAGKEVQYNGRYYRVTHVTLSGYELFVHLDGISGVIPSGLIQCEPTVFTLRRVE